METCIMSTKVLRTSLLSLQTKGFRHKLNPIKYSFTLQFSKNYIASKTHRSNYKFLLFLRFILFLLSFYHGPFQFHF
uniref:Uncharacterized protein n=1 Tax=Octopus bimaculoides TaxID=37653 RepID=A0A0L8HKB8_OCTBM